MNNFISLKELAEWITRNKGLLQYLVVSLLLFVNLTGPFIHQDPAYNSFADNRSSEGIPNYLNIISNVPFLYVGLLGLSFLWSKKSNTRFRNLYEKRYYDALFIGIIFTFFGSSYYHFNPNNSTLVWDRLPMTVVFMSFFVAVIADRVSFKLSKYLFYPLVLVGIFSVWYWHWTGSFIPGGNLRLYIDVQYYPLILLPYVIYTYKSTYSATKYELYVLFYYLLAKLFEMNDASVFALTHVVSGHTIKYLLSAYASYIIYKRLKTRRV